MDNANTCEQKTPNIYSGFRTHSGDARLRPLEDAAVVRGTEIQRGPESGIIDRQERTSR